MAEKIKIFELDIDSNDAVKRVVELRKKVADLKTATKEAKEANGEFSEGYATASIELKATQKELRAVEGLTQKLTIAEKEGAGTREKLTAENAKLRAELQKLDITEQVGLDRQTEINEKLDANTDLLKDNSDKYLQTKINVGNYSESIIDAVTQLKAQEAAQKSQLLALEKAKKATGLTKDEQKVLNVEIDNAKGALVKTNTELKKYGENLDITDAEIVSTTKSSDGLVTSMAEMGGPVGKAASALSSFGTAAKVALGPIGLIVGAITLIVASLREFFTSSEEGQNALKRLQAVFDVVFGNISDILSDVGKALFEVFENPKQAIKDFAELIKTNITNIFNGMLELIPNLGRSIKLLFEGEFADAAKVAGDAMLKATLGVENFTDKAVEGFGKSKEALSEFIKEQNKEIAIAQKIADQQARLDTQTRRTNESNARALQEIAEIRNKVAQKDTFSATERLKLLDQAVALETEILNRNENIAAQKLNIKKAQDNLSKSTAEDLNEESRLLVELINVRTTNAEKTRKLETERLTVIREIKAEELRIEKESDAALYAQREADRAAFEAEALEDKEALAAQAQQDLEDKKAFEVEEAQRQYELDSTDIFAKLELERQGLESKKAQEVAFAKKIGASTFLIEKKYSLAKEALAKAEFEAKLALASGFASNIATIAGEGTAVGKAAAIAATTIDTYVGAQKAYTSQLVVGDPTSIFRGIAAAGASVVSGIANVKKILSVDTNVTESSSSSSSSVTPSTPSISTSSTTTSASVDTSTSATAAEVGQGIVSRDSASSVSTSSVQTVLVTDEVTYNQNLSDEISSVAVS